jgi:hypothetical protein
MADRGRGGPRQPRNPAPVSNPGSGRRTDGGAGSQSQPLRVPSGGAYGERKALTEQQQGAPLGAGGPAAAPNRDMISGANQPQPTGVFGPTERPMESNSANNMDPTAIENSPDAVLRQMYAVFPSPHIARLIGTSSRAQEEGPPPV